MSTGEIKPPGVPSATFKRPGLLVDVFLCQQGERQSSNQAGFDHPLHVPSCKKLSVYSSKSQTNGHKNEEPMTKLEGENVTEQREGDDGEATVPCLGLEAVAHRGTCQADGSSEGFCRGWQSVTIGK